MGGDSGKPGASEAASLVFRIATVGLSLASAIMTAASTQCVPGGPTVSYSDYNSFKYSAVADLLSAVLQGVAIYLQVVKKEKAAKAVELIDKLLLALTSTSASLLFAVDDITSCRHYGDNPRSSSRRFCTQAGRFCGRIRASSFFSLAAVGSVSVSVYARHVPVSVTLTPKPPAPVVQIRTPKPKPPPPVVKPTKPPSTTGTECEGEVELCKEHMTDPPPSPPVRPSPPCTMPPTTQRGCGNPAPPVTPRPSCGCSRLTIQHGCQTHDRSMITEPEEPCVVVHASVPTRQTTQPHGMYSHEPPRLGFYRSS